MAECANGWFSPELRLLVAEYNNSKLQIHQDTLLCKQSIAELELLCKEEELERKVRANNKLKQRVSSLQEQLEYLASELKDTNSQLQGTENTLKVATKAIQTGEILAADVLVPHICVTEVPVQNHPATDELSLQTRAEQSREFRKDTPEKDEIGEGQQTGTDASRKRRFINGQEKKASFTVSKRRRKGHKNPKHSKQGQENNNSEEHTADGESKISIKKNSKENETSVLMTASFTTTSNGGKPEVSSQRKTVNKDVSNNSSRSASKENETHFLISNTPAKLQQRSTNDIENRNKHDSHVDSHNLGDTTEELDEHANTKVENTSNIYPENLSLVHNEDIGQMLEKEKATEIKHTRATNESQKLEDKTVQDMMSAAHTESNLEIETTSRYMKSSEIQMMLSDAVEALQDNEPSRTAAKVKRQRNTIPKKGNKKKETENDDLYEDVQGVGKNTVEKCKDENNENRCGRVLRCRNNKQRSEVERNTNKCVAKKEVPKKTRQRKDTSVSNKKVVTQTVTNSAKNLHNYNAPPMQTSSQQGELLSQQTNLSSPETDRITADRERPYEGIMMTYMPAYQAETEEPRESEKLVESIQSNPFGDYDSVRESRSSSANRINKSKENSDRGSFQASTEGMKSFRKHHEEKPRAIKEYECSSRNRTAETGSDKQNIASSTVQCHSDTNNGTCSRDDDSSENHNTALTKRNGQNAVEISIIDITKSDEKAKMVGKKRKPTTSERECVASETQQINSDTLSVLDCTKKRKTLFNSRENTLLSSMIQSVSQVSFTNTILSKSRSNAGIPPSLSAFMRSFIAPKLKKTG